MNKGLIAGTAAAAAVLAAAVAAFVLLGGGADPRAQVDALVARMALPDNATVDYRDVSMAGMSGDIAVAGVRVDGAGEGGAVRGIRARRVVLGALDGAEWPRSVRAQDVEVDGNGFTATAASLSGEGIDPATRRPASGRIEDVRVEALAGGTVTVDTIELRALDTKGEVPERLDLAARGLAVPSLSGRGAPLGRILAELGYDAPVFDIDYAYSYDPATRVMELRSVRVAGADMGGLTLSATFADVPAEALREPIGSALTAQDAKLTAAELRFDDASLTDRVIAYTARKEGLAPETMRGQAIEALEVEARTAEEPVLRQALRAVQDFVEKPGTIRVVLAPPEPVALAALRTLPEDPDALQRILGLRVEAE